MDLQQDEEVEATEGGPTAQRLSVISGYALLKCFLISWFVASAYQYLYLYTFRRFLAFIPTPLCSSLTNEVTARHAEDVKFQIVMLTIPVRTSYPQAPISRRSNVVYK